MAIVAAAVLLGSCSSMDCSMYNLVELKVSLQGSTDSLSVSTIRQGGADTLIYNKGVVPSEIGLPMSYAQDADKLIFSFKDSLDVVRTDTVTIAKTNEPYFESVDCSAQYTHTITAVSSTHNAIDSVVINSNKVSANANEENLLIYLHP